MKNFIKVALLLACVVTMSSCGLSDSKSSGTTVAPPAPTPTPTPTMADVPVENRVSALTARQSFGSVTQGSRVAVRAGVTYLTQRDQARNQFNQPLYVFIANIGGENVPVITTDPISSIRGSRNFIDPALNEGRSTALIFYESTTVPILTDGETSVDSVGVVTDDNGVPEFSPFMDANGDAVTVIVRGEQTESVMATVRLLPPTVVFTTTTLTFNSQSANGIVVLTETITATMTVFRKVVTDRKIITMEVDGVPTRTATVGLVTVTIRAHTAIIPQGGLERIVPVSRTVLDDDYNPVIITVNTVPLIDFTVENVNANTVSQWRGSSAEPPDGITLRGVGRIFDGATFASKSTFETGDLYIVSGFWHRDANDFGVFVDGTPRTADLPTAGRASYEGSFDGYYWSDRAIEFVVAANPDGTGTVPTDVTADPFGRFNGNVRLNANFNSGGILQMSGNGGVTSIGGIDSSSGSPHFVLNFGNVLNDGNGNFFGGGVSVCGSSLPAPSPTPLGTIECEDSVNGGSSWGGQFFGNPVSLSGGENDGDSTTSPGILNGGNNNVDIPPSNWPAFFGGTFGAEGFRFNGANLDLLGKFITINDGLCSAADFNGPDDVDNPNKVACLIPLN